MVAKDLPREYLESLYDGAPNQYYRSWWIRFAGENVLDSYQAGLKGVSCTRLDLGILGVFASLDIIFDIIVE